MRTFVDFKESDMRAFIGVSDMSIFSSLYNIIQDGMAVATSSRLLMVLAHLPLNPPPPPPPPPRTCNNYVSHSAHTRTCTARCAVVHVSRATGKKVYFSGRCGVLYSDISI